MEPKLIKGNYLFVSMCGKIGGNGDGCVVGSSSSIWVYRENINVIEKDG